jgi:hypothetical protein
MDYAPKSHQNPKFAPQKKFIAYYMHYCRDMWNMPFLYLHFHFFGNHAHGVEMIIKVGSLG